MHQAFRVSLVQVFPDSSNVSNCQGARATYVVYMTGRGSVFVKYRAKIAGLVADRYGIITDSNIGNGSGRLLSQFTITILRAV